MEYRIYTIAERPDLEGPGQSFNALAWPEFMVNDPVADRYWNLLFTRFAAVQFVVCDKADTPIAMGNTIPFHWDGTLQDLPQGWDAVFERGNNEFEQGKAPNTLSALSATIHPDYQGRGLSPLVISTMRRLAGEQGFTVLVAPVRPSQKSRYPLTPMERYAAWTTEEGAPFDPWLRVHWRLGARQIALAPKSMIIPAPVAIWELWARMRFPDSGIYIVPGALEPVRIDREADLGIFVEPNVWMKHRVE